jgi:hypothetical protein
MTLMSSPADTPRVTIIANPRGGALQQPRDLLQKQLRMANVAVDHLAIGLRDSRKPTRLCMLRLHDF